MKPESLERKSEWEWVIKQTGRMTVPGVIFASEALIRDMDEKVREQMENVAALPGIVKAAYAMPDAHWGYGFPIGGVAAFDPHEGVISAGGVGFDIACGVRTLLTGLTVDDLLPKKEKLAEDLFYRVPAGVGSTGNVHLDGTGMHGMLTAGARWAVSQGFGRKDDLLRIEHQGEMIDADPEAVSPQAQRRQQDEMGTLGSGNHYLEVQKVVEVYDPAIARVFDVQEGDIAVSIHCGSRGLGHQVATDYLKKMNIAAAEHGLQTGDRELACAPAKSCLGQEYLGAMHAAINCAFANRQILTHLVRGVFEHVFQHGDLPLLYDVSHNTCSAEDHVIDGRKKRVFVHRKGATRAFGPGHADLPEDLRPVGQPVLIGGTMGTASYILAGTEESETLAFSSACHGAGRNMSRHEATKRWQGREVVGELAEQDILIKSRSLRGIAEEAPGAYKDVSAVVEATHQKGLARKVARLAPLICVKG